MKIKHHLSWKIRDNLLGPWIIIITTIIIQFYGNAFSTTHSFKKYKELLNLSLSSCHAASMDLPDPLLPPVPIVHCSQEIFQAISCIGTELLYIGSSWSSCLWSFMWRSLQEYIAYEFVLTSPAVSGMFGSSNFCDGW